MFHLSHQRTFNEVGWFILHAFCLFRPSITVQGGLQNISQAIYTSNFGFRFSLGCWFAGNLLHISRIATLSLGIRCICAGEVVRLFRLFLSSDCVLLDKYHIWTIIKCRCFVFIRRAPCFVKNCINGAICFRHWLYRTMAQTEIILRYSCLKPYLNHSYELKYIVLGPGCEIQAWYSC